MIKVHLMIFLFYSIGFQYRRTVARRKRFEMGPVYKTIKSETSVGLKSSSSNQ